MLFYAAAAEAPSWTDKLEAWSTFGGAIFTAGAVIVAFLAWRRDQRLRREDKLDAEARQARLISVDVVAPDGDEDRGWTGVRFIVRNNSESMIANASVRISVGDDAPGRPEFIHDVPGSATKDGVAPLPEPAVWPSNPVAVDRPLSDNGVRAQIWFTDSIGANWKREGHAEPARRSIHLPRTTLRGAIFEFLYLGPVARWLRWHSRQLRQRTKNRLMSKLNNRPSPRWDQWRPWM